MANIIRMSGNGKSIFPPNYEMKTGSLSFSTANANQNIIPLEATCSFSQVAGTAYSSVKYGSTTVYSLAVYGGGSVKISMGNEAFELIKRNITISNGSGNVTRWLEKVGGVVSRLLLLLKTHLHRLEVC